MELSTNNNSKSSGQLFGSHNDHIQQMAQALIHGAPIPKNIEISVVNELIACIIHERSKYSIMSRDQKAKYDKILTELYSILSSKQQSPPNDAEKFTLKMKIANIKKENEGLYIEQEVIHKDILLKKEEAMTKFLFKHVSSLQNFDSSYGSEMPNRYYQDFQKIYLGFENAFRFRKLGKISQSIPLIKTAFESIEYCVDTIARSSIPALSKFEKLLRDILYDRRHLDARFDTTFHSLADPIEEKIAANNSEINFYQSQLDILEPKKGIPTVQSETLPKLSYQFLTLNPPAATTTSVVMKKNPRPKTKSIRSSKSQFSSKVLLASSN